MIENEAVFSRAAQGPPAALLQPARDWKADHYEPTRLSSRVLEQPRPAQDYVARIAGAFDDCPEIMGR
jgi:hypothetical protein